MAMRCWPTLRTRWRSSICPPKPRPGSKAARKDVWWDKGRPPPTSGLLAEMERQQAIAPTDDGVWRLPEGDRYYAALLKNYTTTDLTRG